MKASPRPAATVLLLRAAAPAPEVLMLQRTSKAVFLPGAYVFPGGALDEDDSSERAARHVRGLDDARASVRLGLEFGGLAYWVAAARECFKSRASCSRWKRTASRSRPSAPQDSSAGARR